MGVYLEKSVREPCPSPSHFEERNILMVWLSTGPGVLKPLLFSQSQLQPEASVLQSPAFCPTGRQIRLEHIGNTQEQKQKTKLGKKVAQEACSIAFKGTNRNSVSLGNKRHNAGEVPLGLCEYFTFKDKFEPKKMSLNTFS